MQNIQLPAGAADAQTAPDTIFGQSVRNPLAPCHLEKEKPETRNQNSMKEKPETQSVRNPLAPCRLEKEKLLPDQNSVNCNSVTNPSFGLCSDFQSIDSIKKTFRSNVTWMEDAKGTLLHSIFYEIEI